MSSRMELGVPVNKGGACGGFLNALGAIAAVVSGFDGGRRVELPKGLI